jgi:hypothetical protein
MLLAVALGLSFPLVLLIGGSALLIAAPVATVTRGVRSGFRHLHKG